MRIVSRAEWGARSPRSVTKVDWSGMFPLIVHHTTGPRTQTVREIQNFHMDTRGWNDIGYNYLCDENGTVYEGRGFEVWGAHSGEHGNMFPAISLIGDFSTTPPPDAMHQAVLALKAHLGAAVLKGHRDFMSTACPGNAAYSKIVLGPAPTPADYFFEALPYDEGGVGPKLIGQKDGYRFKAVRDRKIKEIIAANPHLPVSTMKADDGRYYILGWKDARGREWYRSRGFETEDKRDLEFGKRLNHWPGMQMRKFRGRGLSIYPWPAS